MSDAPISFEDWKSLVGDTNALLLGLGAPVQHDDMGYNKADHGACLAAGLEPEGRYLADVAERLPKYHRQIGGSAVVDRIKAGLDLYGDRLDAGRLGVSAVAREGRAMVFFKYHAAFVDAVKRLPARDRRFDRPSSAWIVSPAKLPELADLLEAAGANAASVRRLATQFAPPAESAAQVESPAKLEVEVWEDGDELIIRHEFDEGLNSAYRAAKVYFDRGTRTRRISRSFNGKPTRFAHRAKAVLDALRARQDVSVKGIETLESWASATARSQTVELKAIGDVLRPGIDLFGFQAEGVDFIERAGYRCIVGDDMGLGKTVQAIVAAARAGLRTLVVCPASLKYNWAREVSRFTGLRAYVATKEREAAIGGIPGASRGGPAGGWRECEFVVVNGDILIDRTVVDRATKEKKLVPSLWAGPLKSAGFGFLVVDESQYYKNWKAKRTKRLADIAKGIRRRVLLTGTVIKSRPSELYSQLRLVAPAIAGKFLDYAVRFCGGYRDRFGFHADGATNLDELHRRISPVYLRRRKADVLPQLPPKLHSKLTVDLDGRAAARYARAAADFLEYLREEQGDAAAIRAKRAEHLTRITALRRLALAPKTEAAIELARSACEQGEKVVIFSGFTEVTDAVKAAFGDACVSVTGADGAAARDAAVQAFQGDPSVMVFAGQYVAAGVGITLTASSKVVFVDEPWTPGDKQQAEDRCHRIGQANCVNVYTILASGTVDRMIHGLLEEKARVVAAVQDGSPAGGDSGGDVLGDLVEMMRAG